MNILDKKKALTFFRIILYTIAIYFIYQNFWPEKNSNAELEILKFSSTSQYHEYFVRYNPEDSLWNAFSLQGPKLINYQLTGIDPWTNPDLFIEYFKEKNLYFQGFLLNDSMALNKNSFLLIASKIQTIQEHKDIRLAKLNDRSPFTAYFTDK